MNIQHRAKIYLLSLLLILIAGTSQAQPAGTFTLVSSAFKEGKAIPAEYTCDGANVSPALGWSGVPEGTKSFALIMNDPDAPMGTWVHWVLYNIPGTATSLDQKPSSENIKATDGVNSWGDKGYNGPCPPGGTHRYHFRLFALDTMLTQEGLTEDELMEAIKGHILAEATLIGLFRE